MKALLITPPDGMLPALYEELVLKLEAIVKNEIRRGSAGTLCTVSICELERPTK